MSPAHVVVKMVYSGDLIRPMIDYRIVAESQDVLRPFIESQPLLEPLQERTGRKEEQILAEAQIGSRKPGSRFVRTYLITYYNPELGRTEVLEGREDIRIDDIAERVIEESVGSASIYPLYSFVAQPILRKQIVPWKLKRILDEREYGTPPTFGAPTAVSVRRAEAREKEIVAVKKADERAVEQSIVRMEEAGEKLGEEIVVFEETARAVKKGRDIRRLLGRLPPLSRARYLAALKRRFSKKRILQLLLRDISFLRAVKTKLEFFSLGDLLNILRIVKGHGKKR